MARQDVLGRLVRDRKTLAAQRVPDRHRDIDPADVLRALAAPYRRERQPDGRWRQWILVAGNGRWLRVVTEADGETVHNTFWDRGFKP